MRWLISLAKHKFNMIQRSLYYLWVEFKDKRSAAKLNSFIHMNTGIKLSMTIHSIKLSSKIYRGVETARKITTDCRMVTSKLSYRKLKQHVVWQCPTICKYILTFFFFTYEFSLFLSLPYLSWNICSKYYEVQKMPICRLLFPKGSGIQEKHWRAYAGALFFTLSHSHFLHPMHSVTSQIIPLG